MKQHQLKHIPDLPVLQFIHRITISEKTYPLGASIHLGFPQSVANGMPDWVTQKMVRLKMKKLVDKGLVDGCTCGCRGDFVLTLTGINLVNQV